MTIAIEGHMSERLIVVEEEMSVVAALMKMKSRHIRHLMVVNSENKYIGIVSDRDLLQHNTTDEIFVKDVMSKNLVVVDIKDSIESLVLQMISKKLNSVVIKNKDVIVGLVTSEDLLLLLHNLLQNENNKPSAIEEFVSYLQTYGKTVSSPNYI